MKSAIQQPNFAVCLVSAIAALAGLLFGFDTGVISGALLFIQKTFTLTAGLKEIIVSSVLFGAMIGSLGSGYLTDKYGRRGLMLIISLMFITGTLIAALAMNIGMIIIGRIFIGIAIGVGSYIAPLFSCWFANFLVSSTFLTLVNALGTSNTFLVYTTMCIAGLAMSYFIVPETKNVSLERIEENIRRGLPLTT